MRLLRDGFPSPPEMDTAVSHAILRRASNGLAGEALRVHRPGAILAFGPRDHLAPGYREAVVAAGEQGFAPVERLAGGRAAVFHEGTISFSWVIPDPAPRSGIRSRFQTLSSIVAEALGTLGVDARVGEVAGEYCPGEFSVNARGATKIMGVGQRILARAAHVGGVIVVSGEDRVRDVLRPVYGALGLDWEPATAGSVQAEAPGATWAEVSDAVISAFAARYDLVEDIVDQPTLALARELAPRHRVALAA